MSFMGGSRGRVRLRVIEGCERGKEKRFLVEISVFKGSYNCSMMYTNICFAVFVSPRMRMVNHCTIFDRLLVQIHSSNISELHNRIDLNLRWLHESHSKNSN